MAVINPLAPTGLRIALFTESLQCGGAEKTTVILANALAQKGHEVDLLMRWEQGDFLAALDPRVKRFSPGRLGGNLYRTLQFLSFYMRSRNPAVIFTQMEKPSLLALLAGIVAGYKNIVPCVHTDLITYARLEHSLRRNILKHLVAIFYPLARRIVAVSYGVAQSTAQLIGHRAPPVDVVLNGFDLDKYRQEAKEISGIAWLDHKTMPVIVACGRLVAQKGHDALLHAVARLRRDVAVRLIILGDGPLRSALENLVRELGIDDAVMMPGFHPNPAACFARADCVALASRVEGLANVLVEALIVGTPVVTTDCPTGPREVVKNGRFGRMVPVDDPAALTTALSDTLRMPRPDRDHDTAYNDHLRNFSAENMVAGYLEVIAKL